MIVVDMREHFAIDPLISKRQQLLLATQLCRMVLKASTLLLESDGLELTDVQINNVIISGDDEQDF